MLTTKKAKLERLEGARRPEGAPGPGARNDAGQVHRREAAEGAGLLLDNYPDAVRAIAQDRADGMVDVLDFLTEHTKTHKVEWNTVATPVDVYFCGIGVAKGNEASRRLSSVANELNASGMIDEAWQKWFGAPMLHDPKATPLWKELG